MTRCFQHPKRCADVVFTFYQGGELRTIGLCRVCSSATSIAALVHEDILPPDYEIVAVDDGW